MEKRKLKTVVLTGGGTAGHITPNLALTSELKKEFNQIVYVGTNGMEKQLCKEYNIPFKEIPAVKLIRSLSLKNLTIPFKLLKSIKHAKKVLKETSPNIVFSKGGYVSIPVAIAAKKLKIPVVTHESDLSLGLANKIISRYSVLTLTAFDKTAKNKKNFLYVGNPVRQQIFEGNKAKTPFAINESKKTILFFGGSLGAKAINDFVYQNIELLTRKYNILHLTGKNKGKKISCKDYFQTEFTNQIENYFSQANIVVCRAGANSIFELMALKKLTLLIPLSKVESRGDQIDNANYFKEKEMCEVLLQEELNCENFFKKIDILEKNSKKIIKNIEKENISNPNKKIVEIIVEKAIKN